MFLYYRTVEVWLLSSNSKVFYFYLKHYNLFASQYGSLSLPT